jgi:hypothetical protein
MNGSQLRKIPSHKKKPQKLGLEWSNNVLDAKLPTLLIINATNV